MTARRIVPLALFVATLVALVTLWAPRLPVSLDCPMDVSFARFCTVLPTNAPESAIAPVDQLRPCTSSATPGASFCLVLPTPAPGMDRAELLVQRRDACALLAAGEAPDFCLIVPTGGASTAALLRDLALAQLRQRLGADFRRSTAGGVQLWSEVGVSAPVVEGAIRLITADAASVEGYFGRAYQQPPAVFLFLSQQSFGLALQRHFGVDAALAAKMSRQLLGVLLTGSDAVAVNGQFIVTTGRPVVYQHELTHVLIHQLAGDHIVNWLDEGLATLVSAVDPDTIDALRASALTSLRTDPRALSIFSDPRDWQTVNSAYGNRAYGVAAEASLALERRVGRGGVTGLLESLGRGVAYEDAFRDATGVTIDDFIATLPTTVR